MAIKTKIHSIDKNSKSAVISIWDGDILIVDQNNILVEMDDNGNIDVDWLRTYTKYTAFHKRLVRISQNEDDLL